MHFPWEIANVFEKLQIPILLGNLQEIYIRIKCSKCCSIGAFHPPQTHTCSQMVLALFFQLPFSCHPPLARAQSLFTSSAQDLEQSSVENIQFLPRFCSRHITKDTTESEFSGFFSHFLWTLKRKRFSLVYFLLRWVELWSRRIFTEKSQNSC